MGGHEIGLHNRDFVRGELDQTIAEEMHALRQRARAAAGEFDKTFDIAFVVAVVVMGVGVIDGAHRVPIAPVDAAGVAHHQVADFLTVD